MGIYEQLRERFADQAATGRPESVSLAYADMLIMLREVRASLSEETRSVADGCYHPMYGLAFRNKIDRVIISATKAVEIASD